MRVELKLGSRFEAMHTAQDVAIANLMSILGTGHGTTSNIRGAIDGVPLSYQAGFPELLGWRTALVEVLRGFVAFRMGRMNNVLKVVIEHADGDQSPVSIKGKFFCAVSIEEKERSFLEVDFREELDASCADPLEVLRLQESADFTIARVLMSGQRKLTITEITNKDDDPSLDALQALARALRRQQGRYRWKNGPVVSEMRAELQIRAARLELAMAEEGFSLSHGALGPMLRGFAEQYLV